MKAGGIVLTNVMCGIGVRRWVLFVPAGRGGVRDIGLVMIDGSKLLRRYSHTSTYDKNGAVIDGYYPIKNNNIFNQFFL